MVLMWSGGISSYPLATKTLGPSSTTLVRVVVGASVLAIVARPHLRSAGDQVRRLLGIGALGIGAMALCLAYGITRSSATLGALIAGLEPIGVILAIAIVTRRWPQRAVLLALTLGCTGTMIAAGLFTLPLEEVHVAAAIVLLGMVAFFSYYAVGVRGLPGSIHPLAIAAITQAGAALLVLPFALVEMARGAAFVGPLTASSGVAFLWLGVGVACGYLLLCYAVGSGASSLMALALYLIPVVGVLLAWILAGEQPSLRHVVGGTLILLAIWIGEGTPGLRLVRPARVA